MVPMNTAKTFSVCPLCDDGIEVGDKVAQEDGIDQHADCHGLELLLAGT